MPDPIQPLTPAEAQVQEQEAAHEGWLHRDLVAVDIAANVVVLKGQPDETISSHAARADEQGKRWGRWMSRFLDIFQKDHGPKAQSGDIERAENVERLEDNSGGIEQ
jgi:hypothetical protein